MKSQMQFTCSTYRRISRVTSCINHTLIGNSTRHFSDAKDKSSKDDSDSKKRDQSKTSKKNAAGVNKKVELEMYQKFLDAAEKARRFKPIFTEEEIKENDRIGKEFYKQSTVLNNKYKKDLADKIWLQNEALNALPEYLREAALVVDTSEPPAHRPWAVFQTPPIKDFDIRKYVKSSNSEEGDDDLEENSENSTDTQVLNNK